ncbi:MAG: GTP 3',8-cyclase MoaA [Acidobacteriota bacterium]|nr:GTP 3',8-cyclase MoaA [Acidobacteriota bacterium]
MAIVDQLRRPLRDLRVSVTDRCNFRCRYCMPREVFGRAYRFLDRSEVLTYEEIQRLVQVFVGLGVRKVRLTGGEPLLRRDLPVLVRLLAGMEGLDDLTLTTNGVLLGERAAALKAAGLDRVTVSLDSIEATSFRLISDSSVPVERVLEGIDVARAEGLAPVKVNVVVRRGVNDDQVLPMVRHFRGKGVIVRFIEYMDAGRSHGWALGRVVPSEEIVERIDRVFPLEAVEEPELGRVARRWRLKDGSGEIGVISSVSQPFCRGCTRARLSPEGRLFLCLFAATGLDLRSPLRQGAGREALEALVRSCWGGRADRYSELRSEGGGDEPRVEMSHIGG